MGKHYPARPDTHHCGFIGRQVDRISRTGERHIKKAAKSKTSKKQGTIID